MTTIPTLGFGTWLRDDDAAYRTTLWAFEAGYRHIDTAEGYGNEKGVGRAIAASGLTRTEMFITTKVAPENLGPGQVRSHAKTSLEKLGLEKVDMLLCHWPSLKDRYTVPSYMTQFAEVQDEGLALAIGVSNFTRRHLAAALETLGSRPIATNQVECHVLFQNRPAVDEARKHAIPITAYCPLARGALAGNATLAAIGERHGATVEQVALAFLLAEGHIVIPASSNQDRIKANFAALNVKMSAEDVASIRKLDEGRRLVSGSWAPEWDS
jgi:2,5-diketo-D-gluconate reductase B